MGIQGLIPLLEKSWSTKNVSEYSGCTVAIDAYCWLHKGVYTCAEKLARGEDCQAYVHYCMRFVSMLLAKNIKPILVFDGQRLPAKADTESKRQKLREQNRKKAAELMRLDKGQQALSLLRRSVDVTHKMALNLIKRCREINVDCIVAPYEADSQLAFLNLSGIAHIVITEDSDLLLFGCKRVLFKMDQNGNGLLIEQEKLHLSMNVSPEQFNFNKFRYMCILSGCDYLPSVPGVGLIKARQFISRSSEPDIYKILSRLGSFMNVKVPSEYRDKFMDADRMFLYQPIYDPLSRQIKPLNKMLEPNLNVLTSNLTCDQSYQLAIGNIDPISFEVVDNWDPDVQLTLENKKIQARHKSIWSKDYHPSIYEPNKCNLTQEITQSPSNTQIKIVKNILEMLPVNEIPVKKKQLLVTEDDILATFDELDSNEKVCKEKNITKKYKSDGCGDLIENILTPEIDEIIIENGTPNVFKQITKKKFTVINPEKQIVSGYFSSQSLKRSEVFEEEKCINPFKCRKVFNPPKKEDKLNISVNSCNFIEENKLQCVEDKKVSENIDGSTSYKKNSNTIHKAFNWKNYSNNLGITNKVVENEKYEDQTIILHNNQNDSISINNDTIMKDNENDIDEGFCSQNSKELNISNISSRQRKRSCPKTGLSKSSGNRSQTLLSKFGFKTNEQLKP